MQGSVVTNYKLVRNVESTTEIPSYVNMLFDTIRKKEPHNTIIQRDKKTIEAYKMPNDEQLFPYLKATLVVADKLPIFDIIHLFQFDD